MADRPLAPGWERVREQIIEEVRDALTRSVTYAGVPVDPHAPPWHNGPDWRVSCVVCADVDEPESAEMLVRSLDRRTRMGQLYMPRFVRVNVLPDRHEVVLVATRARPPAPVAPLPQYILREPQPAEVGVACDALRAEMDAHGMNAVPLMRHGRRHEPVMMNPAIDGPITSLLEAEEVRVRGLWCRIHNDWRADGPRPEDPIALAAVSVLAMYEEGDAPDAWFISLDQYYLPAPRALDGDAEMAGPEGEPPVPHLV